MPTNGVTISGVLIHDVDGGRDGTCGGTAGAGRHVDCVQILGGQNVTVRDSIFTGCATSGLIARPSKEGARLGPVTIENNAFGRVLHPGSAISLGDSGGGDACTGPMIVRANTIVAGGVNGACDGTSIAVTSNILETGACSDGLAYSHNVFPTGWSTQLRDGRALLSRAVPPVGGRVPSYHLAAADRCARSAGAASGARDDIDGEARPVDETPDAGADQWSPARSFGVAQPAS